MSKALSRAMTVARKLSWHCAEGGCEARLCIAGIWTSATQRLYHGRAARRKYLARTVPHPGCEAPSCVRPVSSRSSYLPKSIQQKRVCTPASSQRASGHTSAFRASDLSIGGTPSPCKSPLQSRRSGSFTPGTASSLSGTQWAAHSRPSRPSRCSSSSRPRQCWTRRARTRTAPRAPAYVPPLPKITRVMT
jgi:hypothetical protein